MFQWNLRNIIHVQWSAKVFVCGCVKFVPALAYLSCLALPGSCLARFAYFFADLCRFPAHFIFWCWVSLARFVRPYLCWGRLEGEERKSLGSGPIIILRLSDCLSMIAWRRSRKSKSVDSPSIAKQILDEFLIFWICEGRGWSSCASFC